MSRRPARPSGAAGALVAAAVAAAACAGGSSTSAPGSTTPAAPLTSAPLTSAPPTARPPEGPGVSGPTSSPSTTAPTAPTTTVATTPAPVATLLAAAERLRRFSVGDDTLGVWVCRVALDVTDPVYNPSDLRLDLDPVDLAATLDEHVAPYFRDISHGRYRPRFVVGGEVAIADDQTNRDCVEQAQAQAGDHIDGLVVIADAEHGADQPGGWGRAGEPCPPDAPCPARVSGRASYIGASDFHPDWGDVPAVDLQEHEIGHTLGFPHSGDAVRYSSGIDVMSNSAAPRDVDPDRRHGPGTLAVNLLAAGWLPLTDMVVAPAAGGSFALRPRSGPTGIRLLVLPLDDLQFLTVEVLLDDGYDDHLPASGVAVHLIDLSPAACRTAQSTDPCVNDQRRQTPLVGVAPYTDLLEAGESWTGEGWTVQVGRDGPIWTVEVS